MKTILLLLSIFLLSLPVPAQHRMIPRDPKMISMELDARPVKDTSGTHRQIMKSDSIIKAADIKQVNTLIDQSGTDSLTKEQLKSITSDLPNASEKAKEIINLVKNKDAEASWLDWIIKLMIAVASFLTVLAGIVRKVHALPSWLSPITWFKKLTGHAKTLTKYDCTDADGNVIKAGTKSTVKEIAEPEGYVIEVTYKKIKDQPDTK